MRSVGIKELKAKISEYVRIARAGESILVTDRSEVVAELGPVRQGTGAGTDLERALASLQDRGLATPPRLDKRGWAWRPGSLDLPSGSALEILEELRADRRS